MNTNHVDRAIFGHVVEWLASHGLEVLRTDGDAVHVVRGDSWADDVQRLHKLIPDELHILTCGGNEKPMVKLHVENTLVLTGLTDRMVAEAHERWERLRSDRMNPGVRVLAKGHVGVVVRDERHKLLDCERVVWVKLDTQTTEWPLGFYPDNVTYAPKTPQT
jgi:hypothetical protein